MRASVDYLITQEQLGSRCITTLSTEYLDQYNKVVSRVKGQCHQLKPQKSIMTL